MAAEKYRCNKAGSNETAMAVAAAAYTRRGVSHSAGGNNGVAHQKSAGISVAASIGSYRGIRRAKWQTISKTS